MNAAAQPLRVSEPLWDGLSISSVPNWKAFSKSGGDSFVPCLLPLFLRLVNHF